MNYHQGEEVWATLVSLLTIEIFLIKQQPSIEITQKNSIPHSESEDEVQVLYSKPFNVTSSWNCIRAAMVQYLKAQNSHRYQVHLPKTPGSRNYYKKPTQLLPFHHTRSFIGNDGSCLFRAFSFWRYGHHNEHQKLRRTVIEYAKIYSSWVQQRLGLQKIEHWLQDLQNNGWGGSVCLEILAIQFNVILFVVSYHSRTRRGDLVKYFPNYKIGDDVPKRTSVYFMMHLDVHFEILDPFYNIIVG